MTFKAPIVLKQYIKGAIKNNPIALSDVVYCYVIYMPQLFNKLLTERIYMQSHALFPINNYSFLKTKAKEPLSTNNNKNMQYI